MLLLCQLVFYYFKFITLIRYNSDNEDNLLFDEEEIQKGVYLFLQQKKIFLVQIQHQNEVFFIEIDEMKAFLGINLVMGYYVYVMSLRDYWSTDMAVPFISNIVSRARFVNVRYNLFFFVTM